MTWQLVGFVVGLLLVVAGVALLSVPAGLIAAGAALTGVCLLVEADE